jgi:3-oxoacyl-[acyl-carrier-protein] synthase II
MKRNRVVITGMGILAPNGIGNEPFWESLLAGRSGIGPITLFDASDLKSRIAGEVKNFDPLDYIEAELKPKRMARHTQFAYAATMMALEDAGLADSPDIPSPLPIIIGVSMNAMDVIESAFYSTSRNGPNRMAPTTAAASIPSAPASVVADRIGDWASATTVSSACTSGIDAIADAFSLIRSGDVDLAIAGGTDAPITPLVMGSFIASGLSSCRNAEPEKASRPFDIERDSGVISEGACVMVLENLERAEARGARSYLEITSYAKRRDLNASEPGSGLEYSMQLALTNGAIPASEIDYVSAYGPGHPELDSAELRVLKNVFGKLLQQIPVSSIKGVTGNPLSAAGPFQLASCALAIRDQLIPPTTNCEIPDDACDFDLVRFRPRRAKVDTALVNVRGLGGSASTMLVSRLSSQ